MNPVDWLVIGSGPAGIAATAALIQEGIRPTVIDGGVRSIPAPTHVETGSRAEPGRKAWFGSTDAYRQLDPPLVSYDERLLARVSYGRGGFSRVWGATAEIQSDWANWPEHCRPGASDVDILAGLLPRATTAWGPDLENEVTSLPGSLDSRRLMEDVVDACHDGSWLVNPSVVAVESRPHSGNLCRPCGQCLTGCPRHAIWFAGDAIEYWADGGLIDYRPGTVALSVSEQPNSVEVKVRLPGGIEDRLTAHKVLVGAGPISSAALALKSGLVEEVRIEDTATAFTGVLAAQGAPSVDGFHHGLAQWWIHDRDERVLAQVYPPSQQHAARLASRLPSNAALTAASRRVARHLHPVIAYLCQEESDPLIVRVRGGAVVAEPGGDSARPRFESRLRELGKLFRRAGYWMPSRAAEFTAAGTGYHMGASWPHGRGSDELGRLPGTSRVHFVDASVLPALRLGSITPTVMANAVRIARRASEDA